jgi:hypothetical protein
MYNNKQIIEHNVYRLVMENQDSLLMKVLNTPNMGAMLMENRQNRPNKNEILSAVGSSLFMNEDFIKSNYRSLSNPNVSTLELKNIENTINEEMLNEFLGWIWKVAKAGGKWVLEKIIKKTPKTTPDVPPVTPKPTAPNRNPFDLPPGDGRPRTPNDYPDNPAMWDVDQGGPYGPGGPWNPETGTYDPLPTNPNFDLDESVSKFNHNLKYLLESNQQIELNYLHSKLRQITETKYLLELAIQRNQVNRIIDRI